MLETYIVSTGSFLPGPAVGNDEIEEVLGAVHGRPSRLKARILKSNGIQRRHYALDREQHTTYQNCELAARAAQACLSRAGMPPVDMLAVATTQGDLPLPGLASLVQGELHLPPCEILTTHGVCSAGMMALKSAFNSVRLGERESALVCASELASRLLKRSRYEACGRDGEDFEAEFLRWMLSDGAGAFLLSPRPRGRCLRIDWIEIFSYGGDYDVCMSCGSNGKRSWQDYETYAEAEKAGALLIRQDLRLLDNIVKVGVDGFLRLIERGRIQADEIDHMLCHYSSHHFRGRIAKLLEMAGTMVPPERWFTNLYTKGNTGCASIFIMLDELFWSDRLEPGQTVFCVVPESGRFTVAYMKGTIC
ncbi:MAG: beta-ketoacyl-ACP synthase III [Candidatus Xenobia bacterium]